MAKLGKSIVIVGAKRTAFGTMGGTLKAITATDLAVFAIGRHGGGARLIECAPGVTRQEVAAKTTGAYIA